MLKKVEGLGYRGVALILILFSLLPLAASLVLQLVRNQRLSDEWWESILINVGVEMLGVAVTFVLLYVILEGRDQQRAVQSEKSQLIAQMAHADNAIAREAIRRLRRRGWLYDGSLHGADLFRANLQNAKLWGASLRGVDLRDANLQDADLTRVDLRGANLWGANLQNTWLEKADLKETQLRDANLQRAKLPRVENLSDEQIVQMKSLWGATLPDGTHYDGRYNLSHDVAAARAILNERSFLPGLEDEEDAKAMAEYYEVSLVSFDLGQVWARKNLPQLRDSGHEPPEMGKNSVKTPLRDIHPK